MVPVFFFFCGVALGALMGATTFAISSSVEGGEEREESESAMLVMVGLSWGWVAEGARSGRAVKTEHGQSDEVNPRDFR
jgi:hypothetical protein